MPLRIAAWRIVSPGFASISTPSTLSLGTWLDLAELSAEGTGLLLDVSLELVLELREVALGGPREGLGEDADRLARRVLRDHLDRLEVLGAAAAVLDPAEELLHPPRPLAARSALAAALV